MNINELFEFCKVLKSDYIVTEGNMIMGTDKSFVYFKKMQVDFNLPTLTIDMLSMQKQLKESDGANTTVTFDYDIYKGIAHHINVLSTLITPTVITFNNIQDEPDFFEALHLKTSQGIRYIRRNGRYIIPIFNGLLPIVKDDKIDLIIHDIDNYQFLCQFVIHKKKKMFIDVYLLCRHGV